VARLQSLPTTMLCRKVKGYTLLAEQIAKLPNCLEENCPLQGIAKLLRRN